MTIGDKIRLLRKERKVSIRKLSELTGLSKSTLSDLENNYSKKPTVDSVSRIAKALEVPVSQLIEENLESTAANETAKHNTIDQNTNASEVFLRSVARAKERPKEIQDRIAAFIDLILEQEEKK